MYVLYWLDLAKKMDLRWQLVWLLTIIQEWKKETTVKWYKEIVCPWLLPCGSSPDHLYVCYFTEATHGNVRIRLCVTIIFEYFYVSGKSQDFENKTPAESAKHIIKTAFTFISPLFNFTRHTLFSS